MTNPPTTSGSSSSTRSTDNAPVRRGHGDTFTPIELPLSEWAKLEYPQFVAAVRDLMSRFVRERLNFYRTHHRNKAWWANFLRGAMVAAGCAGILFTAAASAARFAQLDEANATGDLLLLVLALLSYAVMAVLSLIDRGIEGSGSYFRAIASIMAIRDQWTAYQFDELAATLKKDASEEEVGAARTLRIERARALCAAVDAISSKEIGEWKGAYETSVKSLADTAASGVEAMSGKFDAAIAAFKQEAAKRAADEAEAAKSATPAAINLAISGEAKGAAKVWIDGQLRGEGDHRSFAFTGLTRGPHVLKVTLSGEGATRTAERAFVLTSEVMDVSVDIK